MNPIEYAQKAAFAALEKKAIDPVILDVRGISDITDVHVVCAGENDKQTRAIADAVQEMCQKQFALKPLAIEGEKAGQWILIDFGAMMVHVFLRDVRQHYGLERLWPKAKQIAVDLSTRPSKIAAAAPKPAATKPAAAKPVAKVAAKPAAAKPVAKAAAKPAAAKPVAKKTAK